MDFDHFHTLLDKFTRLCSGLLFAITFITFIFKKGGILSRATIRAGAQFSKSTSRNFGFFISTQKRRNEGSC